MEGLNALIQKTLVAKFVNNKEIHDELISMDSTKFAPAADGTISVALSGERTLRLDLSKSKVSSALYGEVEPKKHNAVCLNVATLIEPFISGTILGPKNEIILGTSFNEMYVSDEAVGHVGEV